jgi:hypothetical protein
MVNDGIHVARVEFTARPTQWLSIMAERKSLPVKAVNSGGGGDVALMELMGRMLFRLCTTNLFLGLFVISNFIIGGRKNEVSHSCHQSYQRRIGLMCHENITNPIQPACCPDQNIACNLLICRHVCSSLKSTMLYGLPKANSYLLINIYELLHYIVNAKLGFTLKNYTSERNRSQELKGGRKKNGYA